MNIFSVIMDFTSIRTGSAMDGQIVTKHIRMKQTVSQSFQTDKEFICSFPVNIARLIFSSSGMFASYKFKMFLVFTGRKQIFFISYICIIFQ